jgi:hypothetical protein
VVKLFRTRVWKSLRGMRGILEWVPGQVSGGEEGDDEGAESI